MSVFPISKTQAADALRAAAVHYDDPDHPQFGRTLIHCVMSFTGADWDLDDALRTLIKADEVAWTDHPMGHVLAMRCDGVIYRFDCKQPEVAS